MALKRSYQSVDEIPEQYRDLYTERGGKFEFTGVEGIKSDDDVSRLQSSLDAERDAHRKTKNRLRPLSFGGKSIVEMNDDELRSTVEKLDGYDELVARAGKVDEGAINQIVESRLRTKLAPIERERDQFKTQLDETKTRVAEYETKEKRRTVHDAAREALKSVKGFITTAEEDALYLAERMLDVGEDGKVVTRDGVGVTPGVAPEVWVAEMLPKRPHWVEASQGGGAKGGRGGNGFANNPWSKEHWNLTKQGEFYQQYGEEKAEQAARAAGSHIGATAPKQ